MSEKSGNFKRVILLRNCTGHIELSGHFNPLSITGAERRLVNKICELVDDYEGKHYSWLKTNDHKPDASEPAENKEGSPPADNGPCGCSAERAVHGVAEVTTPVEG